MISFIKRWWKVGLLAANAMGQYVAWSYTGSSHAIAVGIGWTLAALLSFWLEWRGRHLLLPSELEALRQSHWPACSVCNRNAVERPRVAEFYLTQQTVVVAGTTRRSLQYRALCHGATAVSSVLFPEEMPLTLFRSVDLFSDALQRARNAFMEFGAAVQQLSPAVRESYALFETAFRDAYTPAWSGSVTVSNIIVGTTPVGSGLGPPREMSFSDPIVGEISFTLVDPPKTELAPVKKPLRYIS